MGKSGGRLAESVDSVVVGELEEVTGILPVVFPAIDKSTKAFNDLAAHPLDNADSCGNQGVL